MDIKAHLEACVTLVYWKPWYIQNPGIFRTLVDLELWHIQNLGMLRTLVYSEPCYIQNPGIFKTGATFRTLIYSGFQAYSQLCQL